MREHPSPIDALLASDELSIRWRTRTLVQGEHDSGPGMDHLREEVRHSSRVRDLLEANSRVHPGAYAKWHGAHWVLLALSELGYPASDPLLEPLRDEILTRWLADRYRREEEVESVEAGARETAVPRILESRRLPGGGWAADATYGPKAERGSNVDAVDWGPVGDSRGNPWVTINALYVLRAAGRSDHRDR